MFVRQVVLDTETTGINPKLGHRIIEIGCVELVDRRLTGNHYHTYINPEREVEQEAIGVHGITNEFLADKPLFSSISESFKAFVKGSELVIHNAAFDVGFIDHEFMLMNPRSQKVTDYCTVLDTLAMARKRHPGQKNNLDALCKRYGIDNGHRDLHGALLDAEILADVYLLLSGGQTAMDLSAAGEKGGDAGSIRRVSSERQPLAVISASDDEMTAHEKYLDGLASQAESVIWRR
jgi:DNA polymerase-3 subunit epsilon